MSRLPGVETLPPLTHYRLTECQDPVLGTTLLGHLGNGNEVVVYRLKKRPGQPQEWALEERRIVSPEDAEEFERTRERLMMEDLLV